MPKKLSVKDKVSRGATPYLGARPFCHIGYTFFEIPSSLFFYVKMLTTLYTFIEYWLTLCGLCAVSGRIPKVGLAG
jgi:hypothetical protein